MVIAYLTGIERSRFRYGNFSKEEQERIEVAREIIKHYKTLKLMRIPDPSIEQIKNVVREQVILSGCKYVFYDYIFISPKLLEEFRGHGLRNDELLLLMTTASSVLSSWPLVPLSSVSAGVSGMSCASCICSMSPVGVSFFFLVMGLLDL